MATDYTARLELDLDSSELSEGRRTELQDLVRPHGGSVISAGRGRLVVTATVAVDGLEQAVAMVLEVVRSAASLGTEFASCEVVASGVRADRAGFPSLPALIGTAEAARILDVSQQRVLQLVYADRLRAAKAGRSLVLSRHEVEQFAEQTRPAGDTRAVPRA